MEKKAVILLSGGIDSATTLALAQREGFLVHALTFLYGQRHRLEVEFARKLAERHAVSQMIIEIGADIFSTSSLIDGSGMQVPRGRRPGAVTGIPSTYVPGRNILFLSYALSYAETIGAFDIFIGVHTFDYSGYPDCRPEFIAAYEEMANKGTRAGTEGTRIRIRAPLINLKKSEIIRIGVDLGVDYSLTCSCYSPTEEGMACGACDSCLIRKNAFSEAGLPDPALHP